MSVQNSAQRKISVSVGLQANLPNPANIEAGQFFFASDTENFYVSTISPANVRAWGQVGGGAGALHGDVIGPFAANTLNGTINTTVAWGPTGTMTFTNGLLVSTAKAVQGIAELNLQAATVINHRLTGAGPVLFMVEESTTSLQVGTGDGSATPGDYHYRGPAAVGSDLNGSSLFFDAALGTGNTGATGPLIFRTGRYTGSIIVPVPTSQHVLQEVGRWQKGLSIGVTVDPGFGNIMLQSDLSPGSILGWDGAASKSLVVFNGTDTAYGDASIGTIIEGNSVAVTNVATFGALSSDSSGTPGPAIINKQSGRSALAGGQSAVTITNSTVALGDHVFFAPETIDGTATRFETVPANGSFIFSANAVATGNVIFSWFVVKAN